MAFSETVHNNQIAVALGQAAYIQPTAVNLALFIGASEISGSGYARVDVIGSFGTPSSNEISNDTIIAFPASIGGWTGITEAKLYDQSGNEIANGTFATPIDVADGQVLRFSVGALVLAITAS